MLPARSHGGRVLDRNAAACGDLALRAAKSDFFSVALCPRLHAQSRLLYHCILITTSHSFREAAMRAELQKLVDSIKEALVLLRRHL